MNPYNPMLDYQRTNLIAQQQMIQNQLNQLNRSYPYPTQNPQFFVKPVGSIEEAKGYPVDLNTMYLFPDSGSGKIYLKRLNTDNGKSELFTYTIEQTKTETKVDPIESINTRLDSIEKKMGGIYESISGFTKRGTDNEKSTGSDATAGSTENASTEPGEVQASPGDVVREI